VSETDLKTSIESLRRSILSLHRRLDDFEKVRNARLDEFAEDMALLLQLQTKSEPVVMKAIEYYIEASVREQTRYKWFLDLTAGFRDVLSDPKIRAAIAFLIVLLGVTLAAVAGVSVNDYKAVLPIPLPTN
jgi:hypothetical protein